MRPLSSFVVPTSRPGRLVAGLAAVAVLTGALQAADSALVTPAAQALPAPAAASAQPAGSGTARPDLVSARLAARASHHQIQVTDLSGPRRLTLANPDGTQTTHAYAERSVHKVGDAWVPLDGRMHGTGTPADPFTVPGLDRPITLGGRAGTLERVELAKGAVTLSAPSLRPSQPSRDGQSVTYRAVARDTDLVLRADGRGVHDELVLNSAAASTSFTFHLADPAGLLGAPTSHPDGSVSFATPVTDDGVTLGLDPANAYQLDTLDPGMDPGVTPGTAHQQVVRAGDGSDIVESVDPGWLAGKAFPVVLDPSPTFTMPGSYGNNFDCHIVSGGYANTTFCGSASREAGCYSGDGDVRRTLMSFYEVGSVRSNAIVSNAALYADATVLTDVSSSIAIQLRAETHSWTTASTWNRYDGVNSWNPGGSYTGAYASYTLVPGRLGVIRWDATSLVQAWVNRSLANNGLMLNSANEVARFASGHAADPSTSPYLA